MAKTLLIVAGISGFLAVAFGAFGAHALRASFDAYSQSIYETAVLYHLVHSAALLGVALLLLHLPSTAVELAGWSFLAGIVLFSGSLYVLAITGVKMLGAVTPFGGVAFLLGWGCLVYAASKTLA